jgi:hypothetical protein
MDLDLNATAKPNPSGGTTAPSQAPGGSSLLNMYGPNPSSGLMYGQQPVVMIPVVMGQGGNVMYGNQQMVMGMNYGYMGVNPMQMQQHPGMMNTMMGGHNMGGQQQPQQQQPQQQPQGGAQDKPKVVDEREKAFDFLQF